MIEHGIVFVIVAMAIGYAGWKLMPRGLRERLAGTLMRVALRRGAVSHGRAAQLERRLAGGDCGACESCGGCTSKSSSADPPGGTSTGIGSSARDRTPTH